MVVMYNIAGRQVGSHVLAMVTLGSAFGIGWLSMRGGSEKKEKKTPPINATTKDEEAFIKEFIQSANMDSIKDKH